MIKLNDLVVDFNGFIGIITEIRNSVYCVKVINNPPNNHHYYGSFYADHKGLFIYRHNEEIQLINNISEFELIMYDLKEE